MGLTFNVTETRMEFIRHPCYQVGGGCLWPQTNELGRNQLKNTDQRLEKIEWDT